MFAAVRVVAAMIVALAVGVQALPPLTPVDEGPRDASFLAFRTALLDIIARKDAGALDGIVDPNIRISFGDEGGLDAFKAMWKPEEAASPLWNELRRLLRLGGTFTGPDAFVAPYVFARWPMDVDAFTHVAIIGSRVHVRARPGLDQPILDTLSYAILPLADASPETDGWTAVGLPGGRRGVIASSLVRSPLDYRAFFSRVDGRWRMAMLVSGD
ncbi:MAG: hypothetical protein R2712_13385 [Vicinamibacterales bacterium]